MDMRVSIARHLAGIAAAKKGNPVTSSPRLEGRRQHPKCKGGFQIVAQKQQARKSVKRSCQIHLPALSAAHILGGTGAGE